MRIRRKSPTKASVSDLQLVELKGSLARKLRFHFFTSWNSKDASHESFVLTNQGCDLNVRIPLRRKVGSLARRVRASSLCIRFLFGLRAVELMVPGDFFSSLMMLCFCVLDVLRHFVHWPELLH